MPRPDPRMQAVIGMIDTAAAPLVGEERLEFFEDVAEQLDFRIDKLCAELGIEREEEVEEELDEEEDG